ncbi:hypothetical protein OAI23_01010 [Alphaproteobacteria bacterium]|nr:hypothetical protein [Alphaproteobacteria bacterium]MDC1120297.1 hypothetical protein [Alphaproteobacteria bacterium]
MSLEQGLNIVDDALMLAVKSLESKGMPENEAHIALLVRLWSCVPEEVSEIAAMLRNDPELLTALSSNTSDQPATL